MIFNMPSCHLRQISWVVCVLTFLLSVGCSSTIKDGGGGGGYYRDDGPGNNPPDNLSEVPDAVPKAEPIRIANTRPYTVMGKSYRPMTQLAEYRKHGVASWYGRRFHGKKTASGEVYDMYAMTAAHPVLPIPSYARVTNIQNGRTVIVRINDRGPFLANRLIDLSYTAAYKLGIIEEGRARVIVESIIPSSLGANDLALKRIADMRQSEARDDAGPIIYLQLGAFGEIKNAHDFISHVSIRLPWLKDELTVARKNNLFKVQAGPYSDQAAARQTSSIIGQQLAINPVLHIY